MKTLLILFCLLLTNFALSQKNADSLILKHKVKTVKIFDSENKLVGELRYDTTGNLVFRFEDKFTFYRSLKSTLAKCHDFEIFDYTTIYNHFASKSVWFYNYDKSGNVKSIEDELGNYLYKYKYDKDHFMIKKLSFSLNYNFKKKSIFEKMNEKEIIEKKYIDGIPSHVIISKLNDDGIIDTLEKSYNNSNTILQINFNYSDKKLVDISYKNGGGHHFYYNSNNQLCKISSYEVRQSNNLSVSYLENESTEMQVACQEFIYNSKGLIEKFKKSDNLRVNPLSEYRYEYQFYQ